MELKYKLEGFLPEELDSVYKLFNERIGFKKVGVVSGKKRELNVWRILGR